MRLIYIIMLGLYLELEVMMTNHKLDGSTCIARWVT